MGSTNRRTTIRLRLQRLAVVQSLLFILLLTQGCSPQPLFQLPKLPCATQPVVVTVLYSTEKQDWLTAEKDIFNELHTCSISVDLVAETGSRDGVKAILKGMLGPGLPGRPTIWSPANRLELQMLSDQWTATYPDQPPIIDFNNEPLKPHYLVYSPLVFAVWQSRATVLSNSPYQALTWQNLHDLLSLDNWSEIGGDSHWGHPKFGQTQPDRSNSGLLTLILMAYAYFSLQSNLSSEMILPPSWKPSDPSWKPPDPLVGFQKFFKEIEDQVWCFGPSSGTYMDSVIRIGPPGVDIITTYESLVLEKEGEAKAHWEPLVMYYPELNIVSDHPFVILQGPWVSNNQQKAAEAFLNFLGEPDQQRNALKYGLRPGTTGPGPDVPIMYNIPGNKFLTPPPFSSTSGHLKTKGELTPLAQPPKTDIIDALTNLWTIFEQGSSMC